MGVLGSLWLLLLKFIYIDGMGVTYLFTSDVFNLWCHIYDLGDRGVFRPLTSLLLTLQLPRDMHYGMFIDCAITRYGPINIDVICSIHVIHNSL